MKSPFSLFLALRYLKPKRTFVSLITIISVLGVMLGITVLILVISVMRGFDHELRSKVLGFEAHLVINSLEGGKGVSEWRPLETQLQNTQGVVATAPFVQGQVLADFDGRKFVPVIRGIDLALEEHVTEVGSYIKGPHELNSDNCIVGKELADNLGIEIGDKIKLIAPGSVSAIVDELEKAEKDPSKQKTAAEYKAMVVPTELEVTGVFESGRYAYDASFILVPLHIGQELFDLRDDVHGLTVRTTDPNTADVVRDRIMDFLPPTLGCRTLIEMNGELFDAIRLERTTLGFLLFFIVIVASFGIMNTLITVTVQKTREIGIMKALGASTAQIVWVFLAQGMVVGFFGNLSGLALGMALIRWRNEFRDFLSRTLNIPIFPRGIYQFSKIPAEVVPRDVAIICVSGFIICSIAALIPAYFAARLDPVKALRYE